MGREERKITSTEEERGTVPTLMIHTEWTVGD
jgi:hypothetical protein